MALFGLLFPVAVVGGIIYAIIVAQERRAGGPSGPGGAQALRRLFQYALLAVALVVAASGISGILARVVSDAAARRGSELAGSLAMTVVGVPVFWILARWVWGQLNRDPAEKDSVGWGLYLNAALIGSLVTAVGGAFGIAADAIGDRGYDGTTVAPFLVAATVWGSHWWVSRRMPASVLPEGHVMVGAAVGLGSLAGGSAFIIGATLTRLFEQSRRVAAGSFVDDDLQMALVAIGIGLVVWGWHWLRHGVDAPRTTLWHGFVILIGVLGGLLAAVIGGAVTVFFILQWMFGDPGAASAAAHFQDAAPALAAAVVGAAVWLYHRAVLGFDAVRPRSDIDRIYDYLVSAVALVTVAGSLAVLVVALFQVLSPDDAVAGGSSDIDVVLAAVTLLLVGAPLWVVAWRRSLRALDDPVAAEAASPIRRFYLFAVFGVGAAVAFGALIGLMYVLFQAALGERNGGALADDLGIPVALLVTTGAVAAYHWSVYRGERTVEEPVRRRDVTLVWSGNGDAREIEKRAAVRLSVLRRLDVPGGGEMTDEIVAAIEAADAERLLVVVGPDGIGVVPVQSR